MLPKMKNGSKKRKKKDVQDNTSGLEYLTIVEHDHVEEQDKENQLSPPLQEDQEP